MEAQTQTSKFGSYIPSELMSEILVKLSVKSLIRFIGVSKTWQSYIKHPTFVHNKLKRSLTNKAECWSLIKRRYLGESVEKFVMLHEGENSENHYVSLDFPSELPEVPAGSLVTIKHFISCNGLVCVVYGRRCEITLWNPSIRKYVVAPHYNNDKFKVLSHLGWGFGFDPKTDDYKVVKLVAPLADRNRQKQKTVIYSLRKGSWSEYPGESPVYCGWQAFYLDGVIYWFDHRHKHNPSSSSSSSSVLAFDLSAEEFRNIQLPHYLAPSQGLELRVTGESLFAFQLNNKDGLRGVWVMKEWDAWTKVWSFHCPLLFDVLSLRANGEILLADSNRELTSYDPKTGRLTNLGMDGCTLKVDAYVESLVLLNYPGIDVRTY